MAIRIFTLLCISVTICSCSKNESRNAANGKLKAVSTITIISNIVKSIGGEKVDAVSICGVGVDPHTYNPRPADPRTVAESDIVFINGLGLEHWMEEMIHSAGGNKEVIRVSEGVVPLTDEKGFGDPDPHAWFDLKNVKTYAMNIARALAEADTANAAIYNQNLKAFTDSLSALEEWTRQQISQIPEEQRLIITSHDAFRYFGKAYGVEVKGLQGISTESKVRTEDVKNLIDIIKQRKLKSVFVETSVNPKLLEQISSETGAGVGGYLYSDSIGNEGTEEGTFFGAFRHNVETIVNALK